MAQENDPGRVKVWRYLYLSDPRNDERRLCIARMSDFESGRLYYSWSINNPKFDRFNKKLARMQAMQKPMWGANLGDRKPIEAVLEEISRNKMVPLLVRKIVLANMAF